MTNCNYEFTLLNHPTRYAIYDNGKKAIPAGTFGVEVAYGQSSRTYKDKITGKLKNQNVYRYKGKLYNV